MNQNYRSTPEILNLANQVIKKNQIRIDKDLFTHNPQGIKVVHFHAKNEIEESTWIVNEIKRLHEQENVNFADFAILYRAHHISRNLEQSLIKEGIPYSVFGGIRFFERKEIKDVLAYLRLISFGDDMSFLRVVNYPKRGIGNKFIDQLSELSAKENISLLQFLNSHYNEKPFNKKGVIEFIELLASLKQSMTEMILSDFVKLLLDKTEISQELKTDGDEERLENIQELINSIILLEKEADEKITLENYLQEIALYTDRDIAKEDNGRINLMTIHTSKGLEFPVVFLCGFSDGIIPSAMAIKERRKRALEEERRLTYVAITRAENCFYITESEGFNFQTGEKRYPSRFLFDIEEEMYVEKGNINILFYREAKSHMAYENSKLEETIVFQVGDFVKHNIWKIGKVIEVDEEKREYQIEFPEIGKIQPINFEFRGLKKAERLETLINTDSHENELLDSKPIEENIVVKDIKQQNTEVSTEPETEQKIISKIKRFAKKEYPEDSEMQAYIYNKQITAFHYMASVTDIELKDFAVSEYKDDYDMQQYIYDKNTEAKNFMVSVEDAEILEYAKNEYPKDYDMQKYIYEKQLKAKQEMQKVPICKAKIIALNEYPFDYDMQLYIYEQNKPTIIILELGNILNHSNWGFGEIIEVDNETNEYSVFFINDQKSKKIRFDCDLINIEENKATIEKTKQVVEFFAEHLGQKENTENSNLNENKAREKIWNRLINRE